MTARKFLPLALFRERNDVRRRHISKRSAPLPSVKILDIADVTHNVRRYTLEKPAGYSFEPGQSPVVRDVWGTITYKGPGVFIAGGAGVTPFIAILRDLHHRRKLDGHTLIVSNRTEADIIVREEFEAMRGLNVIWTVTDDPQSKLLHDRIDAKFLKAHVKDFAQNFYLCGPDDMVKALRGTLKELGANVENVTWEK